MSAILWMRSPSALQIACRQLEEAQVIRLGHASDKEFHSAMETMLAARIRRLREDIQDLSSETVDPAAQD